MVPNEHQALLNTGGFTVRMCLCSHHSWDEQLNANEIQLVSVWKALGQKYMGHLKRPEAQASNIKLKLSPAHPLKLSSVKPGQYLDRWPSGKTRPLLEEVLVKPAGGAVYPAVWLGHHKLYCRKVSYKYQSFSERVGKPCTLERFHINNFSERAGKPWCKKKIPYITSHHINTTPSKIPPNPNDHRQLVSFTLQVI